MRARRPAPGCNIRGSKQSLLGVGLLMIFCATTIRTNVRWHHQNEETTIVMDIVETTTIAKSGHHPSIKNTIRQRQQHSQQEGIRPSSSSSPTFVPVLASDRIMQPGFDTDPIVVEKYKLIFFTIRKTGCTVWKQLFRRMMGYEKDWRTFPDIGNYQTNGLVYLHSYNISQATAMMNSADYTKAMFVRDPKERFLSAYLDKAVYTDYFGQYCCRRRGPKRTLKPECRGKPYKEFSNFVSLTRGDFCRDSHWAPQSDRIETKYFPLLNFVGHLETAQRDAKKLLQRIGAWDDYGKSGWGLYGNESIFESTTFVLHKTTGSDGNNMTTMATKTEQGGGGANYASKSSRLATFYTPKLELEIEKRYARDYDQSELGLALKKIEF